MTIYEVFDKVSERLSEVQEDRNQIASYLRDSMDDDGEFTRSRHQKRSEQEGPIPNRELGDIQYIICGCTKPFHTSQVRYIHSPASNQSTDLQAEIIWNTDIRCLHDDIELLGQTGYEHLTIIVLNQNKG